MNNAFKIFEKKKGFYISVKSFIIIFLLIVLLMIYFGFSNNENLYLFWIFLSLVLLMSYNNHFKYEEKIGKFDGELIFLTNGIKIKNKEYNLEKIQKIEFISYDIEGYRRSPRSAQLSNGLDNEIKIFLKDKQILKYNFQQTEKHKIKYLKDILIHYHKEKVLSWLGLIDALNIQDYDEIQEFKKTISN